jgi:uncharacterized protein
MMVSLFFLRIFLVPLFLLFLLYRSQRFFVRAALRFSDSARNRMLRRILHAGVYGTALAIVLALVVGIAAIHSRIAGQASKLASLAGLWFTSSLVSFGFIRALEGVGWTFRKLRRPLLAARASNLPPAGDGAFAEPPLQNALTRRDFVGRAARLAGAVPFAGALYGFLVTRKHYIVKRVEVPVSGLPPALDGMEIVQISDIHIGGFMSRDDVRRAVDLANDQGAHLAVVTGDLVTGASDPLEACVDEVARLRAPLGVWGCNGNHEIYAHAEARAAALFRSAGMEMLRRQSAELQFQGQAFNLIGVDYQRERMTGGRRRPMLQGVEALVRRDVPNILLSHNPNSFPRAAELGIELTLSGHTHGGQVRVEILDHTLSPARFLTPYIAGLFQRPLGISAEADRPPDQSRAFFASPVVAATFPGAISPAAQGDAKAQPPGGAHMYVNTGLGTIGAPVRLGVPPEITLVVLRRA